MKKLVLLIAVLNLLSAQAPKSMFRWTGIPSSQYFGKFKPVFESAVVEALGPDRVKWRFHIRLEKQSKGMDLHWLHVTGQIESKDRTAAFNVGMWHNPADDAQKDANGLAQNVMREAKAALDEMKAARERKTPGENKISIPVQEAPKGASVPLIPAVLPIFPQEAIDSAKSEKK